jgi:uncharacterized membrane protein YkgB
MFSLCCIYVSSMPSNSTTSSLVLQSDSHQKEKEKEKEKENRLFKLAKYFGVGLIVIRDDCIHLTDTWPF